MIVSGLIHTFSTIFQAFDTPFPGRHKILWFLAPFEWLCLIGIVMFYICDNDRLALVNRIEDGLLEPLAGQLGEETLNGIHPRSQNRHEVEDPSGMIREGCGPDLWIRLRGVIGRSRQRGCSFGSIGWGAQVCNENSGFGC